MPTGMAERLLTFDGEVNLRIAHTPIKTVFANCWIIANNINKNAFAKILQPERKTGFKTPKKSVDFLILTFRTCERATLESRKGHSYNATVALLQARLGPFRSVFGPR